MKTRTALTVTGLVAALAAACSNSQQEDGIDFGSVGPPAGGLGSGASTGSGSGNATGSGGAPPVTITFGGSNGTTNGGAGDIEQCTGVTQGTTPLPPVLEFLIDTSQSMLEVPANASADKYTVTSEALVQSFTEMQDGTGTGLIFYPNTSGSRRGSCITKQQAVELAPLDATVRQSLITSLQNKSPTGGTPTHDAYVYALDSLQASTLTGSKYVVLVTDGAPTYALDCMGDGRTPVDNDALIQEAANALSQRGIKTFVIGSPGSESARESLSQMATQGGTAIPGCSDAGPTYCHFDMTTVADLSTALNDALKAITGSVISCVYNIPPPKSGSTIDPNKVNVNFTRGDGTVMQIGRDPDPNGKACDHGWQYGTSSSQIILCPETCDLVKSDPNAQVDVVLGCTTIPA